MLVFDIGGTYIKFAVLSGERILEKGKFSTPNGREIPKTLADKYAQVAKKYPIKGIGVSTAGFVNANTGVITYSANIDDYTGINLIDELEAYTGIKAVIENDVTACLYNFQTDNCLFIAVGTGIGGALIHEGTVFRGNAFSEMEIGHMHLKDGLSFEDLCSTPALLAKYEQKSGEVLTGEELDLKYQSGDQAAKEAITEYMDDFAKALVNLVYILDPKEIIIGGGVSEAKMFDITLLNEKFIEHCKLLAGRTIMIKKSHLGNDAAFLGIAAKHRQIYL